MITDETNYTIPINLQKLGSFGANKEHEALQEKVLYRVHMNHFNREAVDQETSLLWLHFFDVSSKRADSVVVLQDQAFYQNLIKTKLSCCLG